MGASMLGVQQIARLGKRPQAAQGCVWLSHLVLSAAPLKLIRRSTYVSATLHLASGAHLLMNRCLLETILSLPPILHIW